MIPNKKGYYWFCSGMNNWEIVKVEKLKDKSLVFFDFGTEDMYGVNDSCWKECWGGQIKHEEKNNVTSL